MQKRKHKMTVAEAAERLELSERMVRKLIATGRLPAENHGGKRPYYLVRIADIDTYEQNCRVNVAPSAQRRSPSRRQRLNFLNEDGTLQQTAIA